MVAIEADEGGFTLEHSESLQGEVRITLACPAYGGRALIRDLRLEPASEGTGPHLRAAWAWRTGLWRDKPEALVAAAQALAVGQLFISVDVFDGKLVDPDRLAAFVTNAHAQGLSVFVVEGDAGMALPAGRDSALSRLAALSAYQDRAAVASRLDGLQYDIEPYLLPDYLVDPGNVMVGWAETIAALASATALPLEMVLPFWLPSDDHARGYVLPMLAAKRTPITIMAYRTGLNAIQNAAEPLLAWSSANGVKARVALESGPLPDETTQTYIQAADGLLEITVGTDGRPRAALRTGLDGASKVRRFRFGHERVAPASNVSFLGDRERLLAMAAALEPLLVAWPSFAGLALHGMIP
jgi:hypothetical protein